MLSNRSYALVDQRAISLSPLIIPKKPISRVSESRGTSTLSKPGRTPVVNRSMLAVMGMWNMRRARVRKWLTVMRTGTRLTTSEGPFCVDGLHEIVNSKRPSFKERTAI